MLCHSVTKKESLTHPWLALAKKVAAAVAWPCDPMGPGRVIRYLVSTIC